MDKWITSARIGAWKCNFPALYGYGRPIDQQANRQTFGCIGKLHFPYYRLPYTSCSIDMIMLQNLFRQRLWHNLYVVKFSWHNYLFYVVIFDHFMKSSLFFKRNKILPPYVKFWRQFWKQDSDIKPHKAMNQPWTFCQEKYRSILMKWGRKCPIMPIEIYQFP